MFTGYKILRTSGDNVSERVAPSGDRDTGKVGCGSLALDTLPQGSKARTSALTPEHDVDTAIALLLASCQEHILANTALANEGRDPEGVHQMRVGLRRLRSAFSYLSHELPGPAFQLHSREAKWITGALGPARDWDVLIESTLTDPADAIAAEVGLDSIRESAQRYRVVSYSALREMIAHPRYSHFQSSLDDWIRQRGWRQEIECKALPLLSEPAVNIAERVLTRLRRKALKQGSHFKSLQPENRHALRITLKKLRYAANAFAPLYQEDAVVKRYLASFLRLQHTLGIDNDVQTSRILLQTIAQESVANDVHRAIGVLIGWQERDRIVNAKKLLKNWHAFKKSNPFWRY